MTQILMTNKFIKEIRLYFKNITKCISIGFCSAFLLKIKILKLYFITPERVLFHILYTHICTYNTYVKCIYT